VNCTNCLEAQELDGILPSCKTDEGCLIPVLHPRGARALEIRSALIRLHRLKIGPGILNLYNATLDDLELLALAEDELNESGDTDDGNGSEMAAEC
jgi:hypothetical protein